MGLAPSTFTIRFVKDRYNMFGPETSKHDIRWRKGREGKGEVNRINQQEMKKKNMLDTRRTGKDREMSLRHL